MTRMILRGGPFDGRELDLPVDDPATLTLPVTAPPGVRQLRDTVSYRATGDVDDDGRTVLELDGP